MPLIVFECEVCKFLMKHVMSNAVRGAYSTFCPGCAKTSRFNFLREGDPVEDWYTNIPLEEREQRAKSIFNPKSGKEEPPSEEAEDNVA